MAHQGLGRVRTSSNWVRFATSENVRRGFEGLSLRPNAYVWRLLGHAEVLAPLNGSESGYPYRLKGDRIPLPSRVILVADTVEAMTSDRPYRKGLPLNTVVAELHKFSGSQFDPNVVTSCLRLLDREAEGFIKKDQKFDIYAFLEV